MSVKFSCLCNRRSPSANSLPDPISLASISVLDLDQREDSPLRDPTTPSQPPARKISPLPESTSSALRFGGRAKSPSPASAIPAQASKLSLRQPLLGLGEIF